MEEKNNINVNQEEKIVHDFKKEEKKGRKVFLYLGVILAVFFGVFTGYYLASPKKETTSQGTVSLKEIESGKIYGAAEAKNFKDVAEGKLERGGVDGEGSHHLVRPGGESQNVYLTSSVINLEDFLGRKVRVWGETFAAQKAGWLMDVGRLEVLK